ncbi:replication protein A 70 kDa DNA-binding subunit D-like isoform X1 [Rhododendron vialii]|uniref:replication protein A 70 kDa DNA-binding subunit D-like isoform X1 n=1 Tax=Rhododendron vialii TaxID=182163 RepID=UPI00265EA26D|nr:replication protein A 70 kDa DNA-binding subunit D-like isoform X1 [Rhododendron vialii]XP_058211747.1 replication protein A 70 kDa DNA-binding subunit D-like isoform X1 [Rhododendron vialii]
MSIVSLDQNFWYMSCSNCRKAISAREETLFDCFQCNSKKVMAKPRVKFEVLLTDAFGSMTATMFENHAEEYFLVDGKTIMKYAAENDENVVAIFPKLAIENEYQIQLKRRKYPSHGVKVLAYNINSIKPALNEDNSKQNEPTNTGKSSGAEIYQSP